MTPSPSSITKLSQVDITNTRIKKVSLCSWKNNACTFGLSYFCTFIPPSLLLCPGAMGSKFYFASYYNQPKITNWGLCRCTPTRTHTHSGLLQLMRTGNLIFLLQRTFWGLMMEDTWGDTADWRVSKSRRDFCRTVEDRFLNRKVVSKPVLNAICNYSKRR